MRYTLFHRKIKVADIEIDENGFVRKVRQIYNHEHLPVGTQAKRSEVDRAALNQWWVGRSIPASRSGVRNALGMMGVAEPQMLVTKCFGLSLSDQYWVRPANSDLQWEDINFFDNSFSEDVGNILLGQSRKTRNLDFCSPDNTSDGYLPKKWKIIDGKRCLLKSGSAPFYQQPANEAIASIIAEKLNIPHVDYSLVWDGEIPYSCCEDFVDANTDLVSAWRIFLANPKPNNVSVFQHYVNCCESLGIANVRHSVVQMIVLDYLIANEDRHLNNFGLLRNADTLDWIGPAPIFDSGSSFGYSMLTGQILAGKAVECKPFKRTHIEQLALISSFDWIDFEALKDAEHEIHTVLAQMGEYLDEARQEAIVQAYLKRVETLQKIAKAHTRRDDISQDVEKDIAKQY